MVCFEMYHYGWDAYRQQVAERNRLCVCMADHPCSKHTLPFLLQLIPLEDSELVNGLGFRAPQQKASGFALEWELDPSTIHIREKLGEGEFGVVHRAKW